MKKKPKAPALGSRSRVTKGNPRGTRPEGGSGRVSASFELLADFRSLWEVRRVISAQAKTLGIGRNKIYRVLVAVEEACTNIIRHAYEENAAKRLSLEVETTKTHVKILIRDIGKPFDFDRYPSAAVVKMAVDKREKGGYGIHLIKALMDRYEYVRSNNGENHLRLIKYFRRPRG